MDLPTFAAGLALGLLLGAVLVAARAARLAAHRRAIANASAGIARLGLETLPSRSAADILAGRVRVILGGIPYDLPVLPRRASREWLEKLDARFAYIARELDEAADDKPRILALLAGQTEALMGMLRSYDQTGVLPDPQFVDDYATDAEILVGMVEVWRAANPLAASLAEAVDAATDGMPSAPSSTLQEPTGGDLSISMNI